MCIDCVMVCLSPSIPRRDAASDERVHVPEADIGLYILATIGRLDALPIGGNPDRRPPKQNILAIATIEFPCLPSPRQLSPRCRTNFKLACGEPVRTRVENWVT